MGLGSLLESGGLRPLELGESSKLQSGRDLQKSRNLGSFRIFGTLKSGAFLESWAPLTFWRVEGVQLGALRCGDRLSPAGLTPPLPSPWGPVF